jgi:hypothetical protein
MWMAVGCAAAWAQAGGILQPNSTMAPGQVVYAPNGRHHLNFQRDGNIVLYDKGRVLWASETNGSRANELRMQADGNFVLYGRGRTIWSTNTGGNPGAQLRVQNDGNLVMYTVDQRVIWASQTARRQRR